PGGGGYCAPLRTRFWEGCPLGTHPLPGSGECGVPWPPCGSDDFPPVVDGDAVFVRAGAVGGDGTRARPLGSLTKAMEGGATTIVVGPGEYLRRLDVSRDLTLIGVCPERVHLEGAL